jgi:hypothetical protein
MRISRRSFLETGLWASGMGVTPDQETYETHAKGIRILPGAWRPHYRWEQVAWISPPWPSQDYLWLDFPEAIFTDRGLLYLSHVNPEAPTVFSDLPAVRWRSIVGGIAFERRLPNGVRFGGRVTRRNASLVDLELHIHNRTSRSLRDITLQTCAYLRAIREFSDFTRDNKYVHVPLRGWIPLPEALASAPGSGPYRVGWRTRGKAVADWPVLATVSNRAERLVAMTWHESTLSMIGNPNHPCMHADPQFKDLAPGERAAIRGNIIFFQGKLQDFHYGRQAIR